MTLMRLYDRFMKATSKRYTLPVENWTNITHVVVKRRGLSDARNQEVLILEDYDTVQAVIEFFTERKSGWMHPWDTLPAGRCRVTLYCSDEAMRTFYVFGGVIITFDEKGYYLWRFSESEDYNELSRIVGLL